MATKKTKKRVNKKVDESDSVYFLKLVLYLVIGSQWLWIMPSEDSRIPIPIGLILGLGFAMHDHFKLDRKIEFALLLIAAMVGYLAHVGMYASA